MREVVSQDIVAAPSIDGMKSWPHGSLVADGSHATAGTVALFDMSPKLSMKLCGGSNLYE